MSVRHGLALLEFAAALAACALLVALVAAADAARRQRSAWERRSAELDEAQNLLLRLRQGESSLPDEWQLRIDPLPGNLQRLELVGPEGTRLSTLRQARTP